MPKDKEVRVTTKERARIPTKEKAKEKEKPRVLERKGNLTKRLKLTLLICGMKKAIGGLMQIGILGLPLQCMKLGTRTLVKPRLRPTDQENRPIA